MDTIKKAQPTPKGNTIFRGRQFIMTLNEKVIPYCKNIIEYIEHYKTFNYILITEHIGQDNKHYHLYCQFVNPVNLNVNKLFGCHIEKSFGSPEANIKYLKCEDEKHLELGIKYKLIYENGEVRKCTSHLTINDIREMNDEELSNLPFQYYNTILKIKNNTPRIRISERKKEIKVFYICGPSGIGKSEKAYSIIEDLGYDCYDDVKYVNNFWLGIKDSKVALYDDFRDSHMKPSEFINFIDYNKHYMNIKNGEKINNYELIIITSVQPLEDIYRNLDDEPRRQWERRINLINMFSEVEI